jgi:hypothetical protein
MARYLSQDAAYRAVLGSAAVKRQFSFPSHFQGVTTYD